MPGPKPAEIVLTDAEHHELERLVCGLKTGQGVVRRARVVLLAAMGYSNTVIAERVPMDVEAVGLWRRRWSVWRGVPLAEVSAAKRLADAPRPGVQPRLTPEQVCQIIALAASSRAAQVNQSANGATASWPTRSCVEGSPTASRRAMRRGY